MNNLYVYGCSFSEPFGLVPDGIATINEDLTRDFHGVDFWGTHLAERLGINCISKSCAGRGWNYINDRIDEDIISWSKDDIIIISPSYFSRSTIEEFIDPACQHNLVDRFKSWDEITLYNESRWCHKIKTLQYLGYKVYTWAVEPTRYVGEVKNLIPADGFYNWKDWMDQHMEYWQDPTRNKYPGGDWHFNPICHVAVANIMYEFITRCQPL